MDQLRHEQPAQTPVEANTRARLDSLQGLRGCAALLVVVGHSLAIYRGASGSDTFLVDIYGALGVNTFFVISGFLMVYVHGQDFGKAGSAKRFYARRIARIVPLYWTVTIAYGIKQIHFSQASLLDLVRSLFFLPYETSPGLWRPVLGQGWTLNYEILFYLVFGLTLLHRRGVWLLFAAFGSLVTANLLGAFASVDVLEFWSEPIVLYFLAGVAIGLARSRLARGPSFGTALILAIALLGATALLSDLGAPTEFVEIALPIAAVGSVAVTAFARESKRESVTRRLARRLGDASYSIYLTHTFVIAPAAKIGVAKLFPGIDIVPFVLLMIPATAVVGYGVYRFVERPLIKAWMRIFFKNRASQINTNQTQGTNTHAPIENK